MTAFLIVYGADPADRLAAYAYPTRDAARVASVTDLVPHVPTNGHAGGCAYVVEREEDLTFSGKLLVDVFNGLTNSGVARFADRKVGVKRLMTVLPQVAKPMAEPAPQPKEEQEVTQTQTKPKKRGRSTGLPLDAKLRITHEGDLCSPKSASYERYKLFRDGMTVQQALDAGIRSDDIRYVTGVTKRIKLEQ